MVPMPPLNLSSSDMASYAIGDVKTGATFNFGKPASATGIDLNIGWLALAAGAAILLLMKRKKAGA